MYFVTKNKLVEGLDKIFVSITLFRLERGHVGGKINLIDYYFTIDTPRLVPH